MLFSINNFSFATVMVLSIASEQFVEAVVTKNVKFIKLFIIYILHFLMDDDVNIRKLNIQLILYQFCKCSKLTRISISSDNIEYPIRCKSVVPMVAHELFIHYVIKIMVTLDIGNRIIIQIFEYTINHIIKFSQKLKKSMSHISDESNEDVFDLNSDELYAEPLSMLDNTIEIFISYFKANSEVKNYIAKFIDKKSFI